MKLGELSGQAFLGVYFEPDARLGRQRRFPHRARCPTWAMARASSPSPGPRWRKVTAGSPAEKAGIQVGDVITAVDGKDLGRGDDLAAIIAAHKPGDTVTLEVLGAKTESREVKVILGENPQDTTKPWLGIEYRMAVRVEGATPWAGRLDLTFGVRVTGVIDDSPAAKAGIEKGDLLTSVDGTDVRTAGQAVDAIDGHKPGDTVMVGVAKAGGSDVTKISGDAGREPRREGRRPSSASQLGGPWLAPGLPGPGQRRVPRAGRAGAAGVPGGAAPGGIDA